MSITTILLYIIASIILTIILNKLEILNPISILSKGYSVVSINDKTINSTDKISKGDVLNIKLYKGSLKAKVESVGK